MFFSSRTSPPAQTALIYITTGTLTLVWTGVWYVFLLNHRPSTESVYYWVGGFALTGLTLLLIGLTVGRIGQAARPAESGVPPVTPVPPVEPGTPTVNQVAPVVPAQAIPVNPGPLVVAGQPQRNTAGVTIPQ